MYELDIDEMLWAQIDRDLGLDPYDDIEPEVDPDHEMETHRDLDEIK